MKNDLTPTAQAQINNYNVMNYVPDLSTTSYILQYLRAYYTPRPYYNQGAALTDLQAQTNVLAANASTTDTHGYEYCVINDETSATVTARGNVYLGKVSDFVSYFVANKVLTTNYSTTTTNNALYYPMASGTANSAAITMIQGQLVSLGLLTLANGVYSAVSSISTMSSYMRLTGEQTLAGNLTFHDDTYTFSGAKPSQIGYLSSVTSSIQTQ